ncbi:MAG: hypothetical protein ACE5H8_15935, partial [Alphaproteobacteria bacterium]
CVTHLSGMNCHPSLGKGTVFNRLYAGLMYFVSGNRGAREDVPGWGGIGGGRRAPDGVRDFVYREDVNPPRRLRRVQFSSVPAGPNLNRSIENFR